MMSAFPAPSREDESWLRRGWWLWLSLAWVLIGLAFAAQTVWLGGFPWRAAIGWAVLDWGLWIPLAPLVVWLSRRITVNAATWRWALPVHAGLAILFAATIELASVLALQLGWMPDPRPRLPGGQESAFGGGPRAGFDHRRPASDEAYRPPEFGPALDRGANGLAPMPGMMPRELKGPPRLAPMGTGRGRLALPIYFVLVAGAHALAYHRRSLDRERRALLAEARLAEARAMALQTQLQPHFFFNALNTVASLIYTQPEQAEETICALGELMRGVLDASHRREIPLQEEVAFVDRYLTVQRIRFGQRLRIEREIPEDTLGCAVPTLLLQPLVENAVVHGVAPYPVTGTVGLRAHRAENWLVLTVANSCGAEAPPAMGADATFEFTPRVGLANTRARLEALYGADFRLEHRRTPEGGVVAEVMIPWKTSGA